MTRGSRLRRLVQVVMALAVLSAGGVFYSAYADIQARGAARVERAEKAAAEARALRARSAKAKRHKRRRHGER